MRILITGICGFVGRGLAERLCQTEPDLEIIGLDNLSRPGSWVNRQPLERLGVSIRHADLRMDSDLEAIEPVDWIIDAAASPSVLAGVRSSVTSRQLVEHNLIGTIHLLERCRKTGAGMILISTSRVYSIHALATLPMAIEREAFILDDSKELPPGVSLHGIDEAFSTQAPVSLYGATKLASEQLALEYTWAFDFPLWINRCGVMAGAGQFGKADQGIYAFWLHSYQQRARLKYIGFEGMGYQVRDCLHPHDLADLLRLQMKLRNNRDKPKVVNVSGGTSSARSLAQLTRWCSRRWGEHPIAAERDPRPYDLPWVVLDNSLARSTWGWQPKKSTDDILSEIAIHAESHPEWLELSGATTSPSIG